ncbi:MAG: hypothetical protein CVU90_15165 [Firmicutes bacterium HGW-Firmicutes-15]|jgi:short-subunit dehydrogenase involved in D-alanine esterification of teichoic acids|nr:MAG: hypothetical protein CVU90_15165 [Firmicutes bacterium HGW-Firmicutes-15]
MFDLNNIITRFFEVKINGIVLEVEPPKVKTLKRLMEVKKTEDMDAFIEVLSRILSKNRQNKDISVEFVEQMTLDQMNELSEAYFIWLGKVKNHPNL